MLKSSVQSKILKTLPDDRPITAIQIVESVINCPRGFYPICRTYDQDSDADLRESSIFKSSAARYLCLSKTEGLPNFVVQEIIIINEKTNSPKGFSLLNRTVDTGEKAWKKKQICYKLVNHRDTKTAITDIIACSRLRKAPVGFSFAGEINGVTICYKMGNVQDSQSNNQYPSNIIPNTTNVSPNNPMYPSLGDTDHDYEILRPGSSPASIREPTYPVRPPVRPAPKPPAFSHQVSVHSLSSTYHALDDVPFVVNPQFFPAGSGDNKYQFPKIKAKTMQQILKEYDYPFTLERQT